MIELKFFGRLSDIAGDSLTFDSEGLESVVDVVAKLAEQNPDIYRAITEPQVMVAVNQQIVSSAAAVKSGDEIAFLPPVTGG